MTDEPERKLNDSEIAKLLATRCKFLDISQADCERVRALAPSFREFADQFVELFYTHLFAYPQTAAFLADPELVRHLKESQRQYFERLLNADLNDDYVEERRRVGLAHAMVGLEPQWFLGAFNQYIQLFFRRLAEPSHQNAPEYVQGTLSLVKFVLLDVGLTLDAYFEQTTEQLRTALKLVEQSNSALKEFAQLVSHDLKTPLAAVAGLCEEFLDEFGSTVPGPGRSLIEAARARTMKMSGMIDELFAISESAARPAQRSFVSSRSLIDEAVERLRPEITARGIDFQVAESMPDIYAHPGRLREAFFQLISNAVKFSDKQPGRISVSAKSIDNECVFCVEDDGPGMAPGDINKIFAPFRRLPQHRNRPGSGLGLYFVKTIIEEQGGRVWVESRLSEGSKFYIALPVKCDEP